MTAEPLHRSPLTTGIEEMGDCVRFLAWTSEPLFQKGLQHMGYLGIGENRFATPVFPLFPSVPALRRGLHERARLIRAALEQ